MGQIRSLSAALQQDFDAAKQQGVGLSQVAQAIGRKDGITYKYIEGTASFPADQLVNWALATGGDAAIAWAPRAAGMVVIPRVPDSGHATAAAVREFAELLESVAEAEDDHIIKPHEVQRIEREGLEAVEAIMATIESYRTRSLNGNRARSLADAARRAS